jgi:hypothetical protein
MECIHHVPLHSIHILKSNQSLIGSMVIDDELDREMTTVRSPATAIESGMKTLDVRTDSRTKFNWY